ncbi:MAG: NUDIX hydrolase [Pseudomonadota bacterium]
MGGSEKRAAPPGREAPLQRNKHPLPTVDIIIETPGGIVLVKRLYPPEGWAIPGGFVEYGESAEAAARREAHEETSLSVTLLGQMGTYSDPRRDSRVHTISTVFVATATGNPQAGSDAGSCGVFTEGALPQPLAFDHARILTDYFAMKRAGRTLIPAKD